MKKLFISLIYTILFPHLLLAASSNVIIYEVYGAGGNIDALYQNDYIVLYNMSSSPVNLAGWSVQYASASGSSWNVTPLTGTIQANSYFLIKQGNGGGTAGAALPTPDMTDNTNYHASNGKVALRNSTTAFTTTIPVGAIDFLGYGSATTYEGTSPAPALSATTASHRATLTDTDQNGADFVAQTPVPKNSQYATLPVEISKMTVKMSHKLVEITWETASETNANYFEIEHSTNGVDFNSIAQLKCVGTPFSKCQYIYEHTAPSVGINYYRVKQVDFDGTLEYFSIMSIKIPNDAFQVFPTLATHDITVSTGIDSELNYQIFNMAGLNVLTGTVQQSVKVDITRLMKGIYIIKTSNGDSARFVKE